jgi:hypothetical protein
MILPRKILLFIFLFANLFCKSQTFYADSLRITLYKGDHFNSTMLICDTTTNDTIEFDKQFSRNGSVSLLYENNKVKYKIVNKAYFDKHNRKIIRAQKKYHRKVKWCHIFNIRYHDFFPTFYYGKTQKVSSRKILVNGKWKKCSDENVLPMFALYDTSYSRVAGKWKVKF